MLSYRRGLFGDTSFFYALVDEDDQYHKRCVEIFQQLHEQKRRIVTTRFILAEAHALILSRLGNELALNWLEAVEDFALIERVSENDERRAKEILRQYRDKAFSYVDTTCFAVMERLEMTMALSMDEHFVQYGKFLVLPLMETSLPPS